MGRRLKEEMDEEEEDEQEEEKEKRRRRSRTQRGVELTICAKRGYPLTLPLSPARPALKFWHVTLLVHDGRKKGVSETETQ